MDSIDEEKIEEYLKKQGISSMQETGPKKKVSFLFPTHFYTLFIFICFESVSLLCAVASSKEKEARWAEEETI